MAPLGACRTCPEQVSAWEVWAGPELCLKERQETCPGIGCVLPALGDRVFLTSSVRKLMWLCHSHTRVQRDPGPPLHPHCWAPSPDPLQTSHEQLPLLPPKYLALSMLAFMLCPLFGTHSLPESPSLSSLRSQLAGPWPRQAPRPRQWVRSCCHRLLHCLTFPLSYLIWRGRLESGY